MTQMTWLGLDFGAWLAIVVGILVLAGIARYLLVELPSDRKRG